MKKAQLSINTVIITIIALSVLIVIILFFTGKFADFSEGVSDLDSKDSTSAAGCKVACNLQKSGVENAFTNSGCSSADYSDCDPPA
jgi:high-affinity K+ transport system ATPase subunit B